ncbi:MAG: NfeD family protein [Endomicrobium sp.]|jgi:membrane protein implicated in regulation of membrane protease activity|nr:NfeD family protein [Endomicrobium sp.]
MTWLAWISAAFVLVICEILTPSVFFFLCLSAGALFAAAAAYFNISDWLEFGIFAAVSVLSIYTVRPIFKKMLKKTDTVKSNVDALLGANAVVTETISPLKDGFVKVSGEIWLAHADEEIKEGEKVKVVSISGTKLFVKK